MTRIKCNGANMIPKEEHAEGRRWNSEGGIILMAILLLILLVVVGFAVLTGSILCWVVVLLGIVFILYVWTRDRQKMEIKKEKIISKRLEKEGEE